MSPERVEVDVEVRHLRLSNLDKVLFPAAGFTKGEMIDYYATIADAMLPHVRNRPMTLKRYPNGVDGEFFAGQPNVKSNFICSIGYGDPASIFARSPRPDFGTFNSIL